MHKLATKLEVVNDIDDQAVNFFEVLRRRPDDLIHALRLTPLHEMEYWRCLEPFSAALEYMRRSASGRGVLRAHRVEARRPRGIY